MYSVNNANQGLVGVDHLSFRASDGKVFLYNPEGTYMGEFLYTPTGTNLNDLTSSHIDISTTTDDYGGVATNLSCTQYAIDSVIIGDDTATYIGYNIYDNKYILRFVKVYQNTYEPLYRTNIVLRVKYHKIVE